MNYFDNAQDIAGQIALKTEGIAHLLYHYRPEGHGERDSIALNGVAMILEDLAKQGHALDDMLDSVNVEAALKKAKEKSL